VNPGGGSGWDEPPLDIQIPDDARELDREVLAYRREQRAKRRRSRLRRLAGPFAGNGSVMPLLASIFAVCLVAGAMLSVATFSPATTPERTHPPAATASSSATGPARSQATPTQRATQPASSHTSSSQASGTAEASRSALPSASATSLASAAHPSDGGAP